MSESIEDSPEVLIARIERICAGQVKKIEAASGEKALALGLDEVRKLGEIAKTVIALRAEARRLAAEDNLAGKTVEELQAMLKAPQG